MAIIAGTTVAWQLSPRVITIPASDTTVSIVDVQDTLQDLEDDEEGMVWPHLRNTTGGEDLGGGVTVGLTMELQNAQIAFAPRTTSKSAGSVTTANAAGTTLIDSTATFVTDGVLPGAAIVNITDQSATTVISVDSETQLTHYALADGTDNDWDMSDAYKVWNETQCEVTGGNLVAVDGGGSPISAIRPTFGTQVLKTSSSSATATSQAALEVGLFNNVVTYDEVNGVAGTGTTGSGEIIGTPTTPSNNIADAISIATTRGFDIIHIKGTANLGASPSLDGWNFEGDNSSKSKIIFTSADTGDTSYRNLHISGGMNGAIYAEDCTIGTVTGVGCTTNDNEFKNCNLEGDITFRSDNIKRFNFVNCQTTTDALINIDVNGTTGYISILGHQCRIQFKNVTQPIDVHISGKGMELFLDSSVTSGYWEVHGGVSYTDNSTSVLSFDYDDYATLVWGKEIEAEGNITAQQAMSVGLAALAGEVSISGNTITFKTPNGNVTRMVSTTDTSGQRTAIALTP